MNELKVKSGKLKGRKAMMVFLRGFAAAVLFAISFSVSAQDIPTRPVPPRLVNDFADVLSAEQEQILENKLVRYNDTTSTQICIVTVNDLGGLDVADFAYQIGEKWGVGHKENNGAVILIKPKHSDNDRGRVTIQVGYGLEPIVTDALAKRIISMEMTPSLMGKDYYTAIDKATNVIIGLATGQFTAEEYKNSNDAADFAVVLFAILFVFVFITIIGSSKKESKTMSDGTKSNPWKTLFWLSFFANSGHHNDWNDFSGGSGGFGGGGGFGGFGGGHFGGGGASGSW